MCRFMYELKTVIRKLFIACFLCLFLISCKDAKTDAIISLLQKWDGKEILFPKSPIFTIKGKDTILYPILDEYKILTYVDSIGCTSCKLKLSQWKEFMALVDSVKSESIQFLYFFYPKWSADVCQLLRAEDFDYPICIDEQDSLNKLNDFPSEIAFQTFLLDKNNRVLAIGNPIHNSKIKEIYLKIIQGGEVKLDGEKNVIQTKVNVDKSVISLGHFDWQKKQKASFVLKNIGKSLLVIQDVNASCGCTEVTYSKEPVRPGDSILLDVSYKAETPGSFNKTITVYCNANSSPLVLRITGDAE